MDQFPLARHQARAVDAPGGSPATREVAGVREPMGPHCEGDSRAH
jgi:hypothetical protein